MDVKSKEARSKNMAAIKSRDTRVELKLRKVLFAAGFRYRVNYKLQESQTLSLLEKELLCLLTDASGMPVRSVTGNRRTTGSSGAKKYPETGNGI